MAITFPTVFQSAISTNPADTAAGYLTPTRYNQGVAPAGLTQYGVIFADTTTSFAQAAGFTFGGSAAGTGLAVAAGTATTDVRPLSITQTWNNAAVQFDGFVINYTGTAYAAGSVMFDLQSGGTSVFSIQSRSDQIAIGTPSMYVANRFLLDSYNRAMWADRNWAFGFGSTDNISNGVIDTAFSRISAGVMAVGTGAAGSTAGTIRGSYQSSDGTAGITFAAQAVTSITVKDGLIVAKAP